MITGESKTEPRLLPGRRWLRALGFAIGLFALFSVALIVFTRTDTFHRWVHGKVVADLEDVTGGKVELGQLSWSLSKRPGKRPT